MDLEQRLKQLESHHDWHGIVEALEQGLGTTQDATLKADIEADAAAWVPDFEHRACKEQREAGETT